MVAAISLILSVQILLFKKLLIQFIYQNKNSLKLIKKEIHHFHKEA